MFARVFSAAPLSTANSGAQSALNTAAPQPRATHNDASSRRRPRRVLTAQEPDVLSIPRPRVGDAALRCGFAVELSSW